MTTTHATTNTIVTEPEFFCDGYYVGTITADDLTIDYAIVQLGEDSDDWGRWIVAVDNDESDTYATMREAFAAVIDREWYWDVRYDALCPRF